MLTESFKGTVYTVYICTVYKVYIVYTVYTVPLKHSVSIWDPTMRFCKKFM